MQMAEYLRAPGVPKAENDSSTCKYVEYHKVKMAEYLRVPEVRKAETSIIRVVIDIFLA